MPAKEVEEMSSKAPPSTARQDASARKTVFRTVLDSPLVVQWPSLPSHARVQVLTILVDLLAGTTSYRLDAHARRRRLPHHGPAPAEATSSPCFAPVGRPAVLSHLVAGVNAVTKRLEPSFVTTRKCKEREDVDKGRRTKRARYIERLTAEVEEDKRKAPAIAARLANTAVLLAPAPLEDGMTSEVTVNAIEADDPAPPGATIGLIKAKKVKAHRGPTKRRAERRKACRDAFLARRRADTFAALTTAVEPDAPTADVLTPVADEAPLAAIFVCRADLDPPALVQHLPYQVAAFNARSKTPCHLIHLPQGAEATLAKALGLRRAAVLGLETTTPGLQPLLDLIAHHTSPPSAPWLVKGGARGQLQPTAIRHLKTDAPIDLRAAREAKKAKRRERKAGGMLPTQS